MSTKAERGTKRTCQNPECGSRFYDLNRDPITCPVCGTVYQLAVSGGAIAAAAPAVAEKAAPRKPPVKKPAYRRRRRQARGCAGGRGRRGAGCRRRRRGACRRRRGRDLPRGRGGGRLRHDGHHRRSRRRARRAAIGRRPRRASPTKVVDRGAFRLTSVRNASPGWIGESNARSDCLICAGMSGQVRARARVLAPHVAASIAKPGGQRLAQINIAGGAPRRHAPTPIAPKPSNSAPTCPIPTASAALGKDGESRG